jgi:replicative DNA helicase
VGSLHLAFLKSNTRFENLAPGTYLGEGDQY